MLVHNDSAVHTLHITLILSLELVTTLICAGLKPTCRERPELLKSI